MDNTQNGANVVSPTTTSNTESTADYSSRAGSDFAGAAMEFLAEQDSKLAEDSSDAQSGEEASVSGADSPESESQESQPEKENTLTPGIKKRIDSLTAKFKTEQGLRKEMALENAKLKEAVRLYMAELERVAGFAKLDPHAEKIRELELQREIDQIEQRVPRDIEEQFSAQMREAEISEKAADIADQIRSATAEWEGLFTARELALFMQQNRVTDAAKAAQYLGDSRIAAARKRAPARPQAPSTAAARGVNAARETAQPWTYKGASSILDFFDAQDSQRGKRR